METIYFKKPTEQSYFQRGHGSPELEEGPSARSGCSVTLLYFAYGSNMDLNQMDFRCPDAQALETVRLEGYRLAFRSNGGNRGVATILPDPDSYVDGVLWEISPEDERNLNFYEGFPRLLLRCRLKIGSPSDTDYHMNWKNQLWHGNHRIVIQGLICTHLSLWNDPPFSIRRWRSAH